MGGPHDNDSEVESLAGVIYPYTEVSEEASVETEGSTKPQVYITKSVGEPLTWRFYLNPFDILAAENKLALADGTDSCWDGADAIACSDETAIIGSLFYYVQD